MASLTIIGLICLPVFVGMASVSEAVVLGLYGSKWKDGVGLFVPLALAMPVHALLSLGGPVMTGTGRPGLEFRAQTLAALLMVCALIFAAQWSVVVVAWALLAVFAVRFWLVTQAATLLVGSSWLEVGRSLVGPGLATLVTVCAVYGTDLALGAASVSPGNRLVVDAAAGLVAVVLSGIAFRRYILTQQVIWLLRRIETRLPRFVRPLLYPGKATS